MQLACKAANDLYDKHRKALSSAFHGNFDPRVVAVGWLLGDVVGAPLLSRAHAHAVGIRARRVAGETTAKQRCQACGGTRDVRNRSSSPTAPGGRSCLPRPRRRRPRCCAKQFNFRRWPSSLVAAPKKPFWPGASGFRKRKREPLQDQQLSILDDTVLRAHLAMP